MPSTECRIRRSRDWDVNLHERQRRHVVSTPANEDGDDLRASLQRAQLVLVGGEIRPQQQHGLDETRERRRRRVPRLTEALACVLRTIRPMRNQSHNDTDQSGLQRNPDEWKTGDEPMTDAQRSYLETLCRDTGEEFDQTLSKADASKRIDELRERSPRLAGE